MFRAKWVLAIVPILVTARADAQSISPAIRPPSSRTYFAAHPRSFEEARLATEQAARKRPHPATTAAQGYPVEIVQLAQALHNDPDLIYQFVHDNIQFTPMWGYLKGPLGTLLDGSGDSFDQSALMVALLNQASLANTSISNAGFLFGEISLTSAQAQNWLGVDANPNSIGQLLGSAGIPADTDGSGNIDAMGHVWVQVDLNGTTYVFDPSFKTQTWKSGMVSNLANIMGYSQASFLGVGGGTNPNAPTIASIQGVNRTALRTQLNNYSTSLLNYVRQHLPQGDLNDLIGGSTIVPTPLVNAQTVRQTSNPNQAFPPTVWGPTIDPGYAAQFTVALLGANPNTQNPPNVTFYSADIYGHRLSLFFNVNLAPAVFLDGVSQVNGATAGFTGSPFYVGEQISVPFLPSGSTQTYQIVPVGTNANGGNAGYVFSIGWGQTGRGMVEKHRALLTQAINSGAAANSEAVLGEGLAVTGYAWLAEVSSQQQIADQLLGTTSLSYYAGGITGEQVESGISSPYVDLPLSYVITPSRIDGSGQSGPNSEAAYLNNSDVGSALESSILEQTQIAVPGFTAASTVKILDLALANNDTVFDIDNDGSAASRQNYTDNIRPLLAQYYQAGDLQYVDYYVNNGYRVIAPLHGEVVIGAWEGIGLKALSTQYGYAELIEGGLAEKVGPNKTNGGEGGTNCPAEVFVRGADGQLRPISRAKYLGIWGPPGGDGPKIAEPIDTRKGSFVTKPVDLRVGAGAFPYGLNFQRSYDSNAQSSLGPLGYGWNHTYNITASVGSDAFAGMGHSSLLAAAGSIVALYVSSDLVKGQAVQGQANLQQFLFESVVSKWFTDQTTANVVYVNQGWDSQEFTALADGAYAPAPGTAAILDATSGTFRVRNKDGVTLTFNASGQISTWSNAAGGTVTFGYTGGFLTTVSTATNRQLTLGYSGSLLTSVTDGTRTVSYGYTNNTLTTFTDALQQNTTYSYDTSGQYDTAGHLTRIFYPSHPDNAFVTTFYDPVGKVVAQADANGNLTQTFFAGSRSESEDAVGNRQVWYFDSLTDETMQIQDYGPSPHLNITNLYTYDGQLNVLTATMPEGNNTVYTYDSLFNPLKITSNPKPGSALAPLVQTYTYVVPVASLPNFEELKTATDPEGNITANSYSSSTGTLSSKALPAVPKPGAAMSAPTVTYTYTAIGLPSTVTDSEGRVLHYSYDPTFGDQPTMLTVDYGRLNLGTSFTYDSLGDVATVTDANGNVTTNLYDNLRRPMEMDKAIAGVVTKYAYYPDGQIRTITRQLTPGTSETTTYSYTLEDQLSTVTDPLGNTVTVTYDADNRKQTVTNQISAAANRQLTYTYDALSRLYQVGDTTAAPGIALETLAYSPNSNQIGFTDANGNPIGYVYDGFDRLTQTTYPDGTSEKYTFNPDGYPLQETVRSGSTIAFTYDALNRVATKTPAGEAAGTVTYDYDYSGLLLQASDTTSATPYQLGYDTAGRPVSYTDQQGRNVLAQYDGVGNRTRLQWPAGTNGGGSYFVTYAYDALNRMTEIDANGLPSAPLAKYQWDALSRPTLITHGDGTTDSYTQYDPTDNLLTLTESFTGGSGVTFQYGWLKNHQRQSTAFSNNAFQYNPAASAMAYAPADVDSGYTSINALNLSYDGNHNLAYDGVNALSYDVENRLVQAQNTLSGTSQYSYDPLGHRKQKVVAGVTTQFVLAGNEEIADYSGTGAGTAQVLTVRGAGGSPVASVPVAGGAVAYYHHDGLGSTVALTQPGTPGAAEVFNYSEFGTPAAGSGTSYLFAGYRYDAETGLYYVGARYYSPQLGRFLQTDPAGIGGGRNLYAYVDNDPVNLTDRRGTSPDNPWSGGTYPFAMIPPPDPAMASAVLNPFVVGSVAWAAFEQARINGIAGPALKVVAEKLMQLYPGQLFGGAAAAAPEVVAPLVTEAAPIVAEAVPVVAEAAPIVAEGVPVVAAVTTGGRMFATAPEAIALAPETGGLSCALWLVGGLALMVLGDKWWYSSYNPIPH